MRSGAPRMITPSTVRVSTTSTDTCRRLWMNIAPTLGPEEGSKPPSERSLPTEQPGGAYAVP